MPNAGTYNLEILHFNGNTVSKFNDAIKKILAHNPKGLIVDVRSNPGGFLDTAISISSKWVEDGVVVSLNDYNNN